MIPTVIPRNSISSPPPVRRKKGASLRMTTALTQVGAVSGRRQSILARSSGGLHLQREHGGELSKRGDGLALEGGEGMVDDVSGSRFRVELARRA